MKNDESITQIELTEVEKFFFQQIKSFYDKIMSMVQSNNPNYSSILLDACGDLTHYLHKSLKDRNITIKLPSALVKNRNQSQDNPNFYKQIDAIKRFIEGVENNKTH
ncbi:MAG: hypothetical protein VB017_03695 [Endomicrobiaceae bacterium]|nr:hypothetical protein [Endomicrobiaceae bacterium]